MSKAGWSYLEGKRWSEVTRDERFFCQRLFTLADSDPTKFVAVLNNLSPGLKLPIGCEWEVGFEVCFFRDMRFLLQEKWQEGHFHYSPKRTFDLCLFSERDVVVIEAKAQQGFESDLEQLEGFQGEKAKIAKILGLQGSAPRVSVIALASSSYLQDAGERLERRLQAKPVSWKDIAAAYEDDPILVAADAAYSRPHSGMNNTKYMKGDQLLACWESGSNFYVGRGGGLQGLALQEDVRSGRWRERSYETNVGTVKPNENWFTLTEFVGKVQPHEVPEKGRKRQDGGRREDGAASHE